MPELTTHNLPSLSKIVQDVGKVGIYSLIIVRVGSSSSGAVIEGTGVTVKNKVGEIAIVDEAGRKSGVWVTESSLAILAPMKKNIKQKSDLELMAFRTMKHPCI